MTLPRPEYPRPQFQRADWLNLNGSWHFDFDDQNMGMGARWFDHLTLSRTIQVPFAYQSALSGIHTNEPHDVVWYQRSFTLPDNWNNKHVILHFGAVDYRAWVWVNGIFATFHEGGHTPFQANITALLNRGGDNRLVVRVEDVMTDIEQPRGKQYWKPQSESIFYTRTTGIWQTVWLEPVADLHLARLKLTPDVDASAIQVEYWLDGQPAADYVIETQISLAGTTLVTDQHRLEAGNNHAARTFRLDTPQLWCPEQPTLYDVVVRIKQDSTIVDEVSSYFGMRKISIDGGKLRLNNQPYYMKLVLDQGYHPEGILTFPADETIRKDIELTKAMGLNGVRKHQKVEEPRYLYWADRMGLLVWGEMANCYAYSEVAIKRLASEWQEAVERDYNHPCIVVWVPLNESWGVPALLEDARQPKHLAMLYNLTKSLDTTRPVVSNDGWEQAQTDLLTIHDYEGSGPILRERYGSLRQILLATPAKRSLTLPDYGYASQPILLTEFGGIGYRKDAQEGWGYTTASDDADFTSRLEAVVSAVLASPVIQGFCYTQFTDVEQEINGLLTYNRQPKIPLEMIAKINQGVG